MKRALGAVTTWDTFKKMTEGNGEAAAEAFEPPSHVHIAPHVQEAAEESVHVEHHHLAHSHESAHGHEATNGVVEGAKDNGPEQHVKK